MQVQIAQIRIQNYRAFAQLPPIRVGNLATFVGKNDSGKSCILYALRLFFSDKTPDVDDFHLTPGDGGINRTTEMEIAVAFKFSDDHEIEIEDGVGTTLSNERMLDSNGWLHVVKTYTLDGKGDVNGPRYNLVVSGFDDEHLSKLFFLKEKDLNTLGDQYGLDFKKSGPGVTNKDKRQMLRQAAEKRELAIREQPIEITRTFWNGIKQLLPTLEFFPADSKIGTGETTFQNQFNSVIEAAVLQATPLKIREQVEEAIRRELDAELESISDKLANLTDAISELKARPIFEWRKLATFELMGSDEFGISVSLEQRGAGVRRLLMVANFQHQAENAEEGEMPSVIYAVEEPEAFLHPGAQGQLVSAFKGLGEAGQQVVVTTHSPVFAGTVPVGDLAMVRRNGIHAEVKQVPDLDLDLLAQELGVVPAHQIVGYNACVFVEGPHDVVWLNSASTALKNGGYTTHTLEEKRIGVVPLGGSNLKYVASCGLMKRMNQRYAVMLDSDLLNTNPNVYDDIEQQCKCDNALFVVLRKNEIENYAHPGRLRTIFPTVKFPNYGDKDSVPRLLLHPMRGVLTHKNASGVKTALETVFRQMSCQEWLERSEYFDECGKQRYEILEIIQTFLAICD